MLDDGARDVPFMLLLFLLPLLFKEDKNSSAYMLLAYFKSVLKLEFKNELAMVPGNYKQLSKKSTCQKARGHTFPETHKNHDLYQ